MKLCRACGETKALSLFHWHGKTKDGYFNRCKECFNRQAREYRRNNRQVSEARRERKKAEGVKRDYSAKNKDYRERFPERVAANMEVHRALKDGRLTKWGCMCCDDEKTEAHHPDYSKPLDVVWLCRLHHAEIHLNGEI